MGYDRERFGRGLSISILVVVLIVGLVLSTNTAYAMAVAGVGGFTIEADSIESEEAIIYPGSGETAGEGESAQILIEHRNIEIDSLELTKEVDVSSVPGLSGEASLSVTSDETVTADEQMLKVSELNAEESTLSPLVVQERETDQVEESFDLTAGDAASPENDTRLTSLDGDSDEPGLYIEDAELTAHYLATSTINIPDLGLEIDYDGDA